MSPTEYIQRFVNLEPSDYHTIRAHADACGLGQKGFSAALRMIVREWRECVKRRKTQPPLRSDQAGE